MHRFEAQPFAEQRAGRPLRLLFLALAANVAAHRDPAVGGDAAVAGRFHAGHARARMEGQRLAVGGFLVRLADFECDGDADALDAQIHALRRHDADVAHLAPVQHVADLAPVEGHAHPGFFGGRLRRGRGDEQQAGQRTEEAGEWAHEQTG